MTTTTDRRPLRTAIGSLLDVVGADLEVPLVTGGHTRLIHLDYAASAPALRTVACAVDDLLPWYASVHRGAGFTSAVSSEALAAARDDVRAFLGGRDDDVVVFTRNTTDSLNLLARALPQGTTVFTLGLEHHANLLPWRNGQVVHLPTPRSAAEVPQVFADALASRPIGPALVAVSGASNVTGELLPVADIAAAAHRHGARVVVDAAQLAPHRPLDIRALGVDYVALSGHKLYAPFGAGVLLGRRDWLDQAAPYLAGGGAVRTVTLDDTEWAVSPGRHEGGTPNVVGALAIATACRALADAGWEQVEAHDAELTARLIARLEAIDGVEVLSTFGAHADRVGIVAMRLPMASDLVAAALSAEHGIATRDGAFCAHPLMRILHGAPADADVPNAVRASLGVGTRGEDVDLLADAIAELIRSGPRWQYARQAGRLVPAPDPRPRPRWLRS